MNNSVLSKTIAYLRFPLMVGIVFIHFNIADGFTLQGINYGGGSAEWYRTIVYLFSRVLPRIGVPMFFFFSGFLFFYHTEWNFAVYKRKLKTRARTLLLPYLLWNVIAIAWTGFRLLPCMAKVFPNAGKTNIDWSLSAIANTFWDKSHGMFAHQINDFTDDISNNIFPIDFPLWYIRDLMIVVLCTPFVYWLVKKGRYFVPIILGLAWYFTAHLHLGHLSQLLVALFFFSWGAYYSIHQLDFTVLFSKLKYFPILYIVVAVADIVTREQTYTSYIYNAEILIGIVSAIIITVSLLKKGKIQVNSFLAGASFFLFTLHGLILGDLGKIIFALVRSTSPYFLIVFYFVVPAVTILICLGLYKLLTKYLPRCAALLTGGRVV